MSKKSVLLTIDTPEQIEKIYKYLNNKQLTISEVDLCATGVSQAALIRVAEDINQLGFKAKVLKAANLFLEITLEMREIYMDFIAEWPDSFKVLGKTFKKFFVDQGTVSLWWYAEPSQKNIEVSNIFNRICQIRMIQQLVNQNSYNFILCHTHDAVFADLIKQVGDHENIETSLSLNKHSKSNLKKGLSLLKNRFKFAARFFMGSLLVKLKWNRTSSLGDKVVFYTWLSDKQWQTHNNKVLDRYYLDTPEYLNKNGFSYLYLCQLSDTGMRSKAQTLSRLLEAKRGRIKIDRLPEPEILDRIEFVDQYISFLEILKLSFSILFLTKYLYIRFFSKSFRNSFKLFGIDFFKLFMDDFDLAFLGDRILFVRLLNHGVKRFCQNNKPQVFICWSALYNWGRSVIAGAKNGNPEILTIGFQESRITRMTLYYNYKQEEIKMNNLNNIWIDQMPTPDIYWLHSESNKKIFEESGFLPDQLFVGGSPRFQQIPLWNNERIKSQNKFKKELSSNELGKKLVIIGTSILLEDARDLLEITFDSLSKRNDCIIYVKPHPMNTESVEQTVKELSMKYRFDDCLVTDINIQKLLSAADVLVTSYSGVGGEAIAIGCPVINLLLGYRANITPFDDFPGVSFEVSDSSEMNQALDEIFNRGNRLKEKSMMWKNFTEYIFGPLDGKANERFIELLKRELD